MVAIDIRRHILIEPARNNAIELGIHLAVTNVVANVADQRGAASIQCLFFGIDAGKPCIIDGDYAPHVTVRFEPHGFAPDQPAAHAWFEHICRRTIRQVDSASKDGDVRSAFVFNGDAELSAKIPNSPGWGDDRESDPSLANPGG